MTTRITRVMVIGLATTLAAGTLGCSILSQAKGIADTAKVLADFGERLGKAAQLTYTAEYSVTGGEKVTLVQQPPNVAFIAKGGRYMFTSESLFFCDDEKGTLTCQKSPNTAASVDAASATYVAGVAGPGFITPELAIGLIAAAAFVPGAKVEQSSKTVGGQESLCATATGLDAAASPGDTDAPKDFTVCVTDAGILASFSGTSTNGEKAAIELSTFSTTVDASAFAPPKTAKVVDVTQIAVG